MLKMKYLYGILTTCLLFIQNIKTQDVQDPLVLGTSEAPVPIPTTTKAEDECSYHYTKEKGLFSTVGFPDDYAENSNCSWEITVPEDHKVQLTFHLLNIEHHQSCNWDWVKVFESNGTLLKHVCGYLQQDLVMTSVNNSVRVQFYSDSVIQAAGFLASWVAIPKDKDVTIETENVENAPGYVLSFPQSFTRENSDAPKENICLQLINVKSDGEAQISIFDADKLLDDEPVVTKIIPYTNDNTEKLKCIQMQLPEDFSSGTAAIRITGTFGDYNILSYKSVRVIKSSTLSLIQTDKFDYRPKQDVKFRIMLLDAELKPSMQVKNIEEVWISDPANNRIKQWKNEPTKHGIAQFEMKLDEEPSLGEWKVHAKFGENGTHKEAVSFTVSEKLLPKFEVLITNPEFIYRNSEEEEFKICAKYTHGGKVKGSLNVTFSVDYKETYWRAPVKKIEINKVVDELQDGCATLNLNNTEILKFAAKSNDLKINAVAEEAVTGTKQDAAKKTTIKDTILELDFGGSSKEHIVAPGAFPYVGRVKAVRHSKVVLPNTRLQICARLFTDVSKMRRFVSGNSNYWNYDEDKFYELGQKLLKIQYKDKCEIYTTDKEGTVDFSVSLGSNISKEVTKLSFKVTALDYESNSTNGMKQPIEKLDIALTHANTSSALTIHNIKEGSDLKCNMNKIPVYFSAKPGSSIELTYFFTSSGSIVKQNSHTVPVSDQDKSTQYVGAAKKIDLVDESVSTDKIVANFDIDLKLPLDNGNQGRLSNKLNLLVYSRDEDGKILTSSQEFSTQSCNQATAPKISWSTDEVTPAQNVELKLKGSNNGYCGYSVVDKSVDLVPNPNKITTPKLQDLKEDLAKLRVVNSRVPDQCRDATLVFKSFERLGLYVLSDKLLQNTDCDTLIDVTELTRSRGDDDYEDEYLSDIVGGPPGPPQSYGETNFAYAEADSAPAPKQKIAVQSMSAERRPAASGPIEVKKPKLDLRNYFPETWLFDLEELDTNGEKSLQLKAPHTITTWIAETVCTDSVNGAQVSEKAKLLVTQDFFADINMPYSIKRGEQFPLNVSVFSTIDKKLPMNINIKSSDKFKVGQAEANLCLESQDNHIKSFDVKAKKLGQVNITVEAKIDSAKNPGCNDDIGNANGYADVLQKPIEVKPEGFPVEKVNSEFICRKQADSDTELTMDALTLPEDSELVEDSERAWTTVTGDIMAPALSNLEKLLQQPTGCGEQNMMGMVPNIYLLKYLQGKGANLPAIEKTAKKYMKIGYDREQKYRFPDGSYSVWGPKTDDTGSMWLTSFVVKAFVQASKYIDMDKRNVMESIYWILRQQGEDGCFQNKGYALHQELKGDSTSLSASVLVTLLEAKPIMKEWEFDGPIPEQHGKNIERIIERAYQCVMKNVTKNENPNIYLQSMVTYASILYEGKMSNNSDSSEQKTADDLLTTLMSKSNNSMAGKLFWTTGEQNKARDVEMTAYNVLSLTLKDKLSEALKAIRWLATNRNSRGGFVSTQDTMVALEAIAEYSLKIGSEENDLKIEVSVGSVQSFMVDEDNKLVYQKQKIGQLSSSSDVSVKASGNGCFMVQTILRYNIKDSPSKQGFSLVVTQTDEDLKVCASYTGTKETDMVVIEIELLSGYTPYLKSLEKLFRLEGRERNNDVNYAPVKKYEYDEKERKIILYYDEMLKQQNCYDIELKKVMEIKEIKPAIATIYDYYNPKNTFSTNYNI